MSHIFHLYVVEIKQKTMMEWKLIYHVCEKWALQNVGVGWALSEFLLGGEKFMP